MLNGPANERLLRLLGVDIVDDCPADLEQAARDWLAAVPPRESVRDKSQLPAMRAVEEALTRIDERKREAAA